ncbi:efflux transporter outer membrane subunit [Mariprofundus erugo]|nr:efflux transporter outer membrane subunit [Mariprofundus erugo]
MIQPAPHHRLTSGKYDNKYGNRLTLLLGLMLAGCSVGPDFQRPEPPAVSGYTAEPLAKQTASTAMAAGAAQSFETGSDTPAMWWTLFHAPALDQLVDEALKKNPDLEAARAALLQARENSLTAQGVYFPSVDTNGAISRKKINGAQFGNPAAGSSSFSLFNASVDVAYVFDLFGGDRRSVEAMDAEAETARFQLEAARLTVAANVVTAAIEEASLRGRIAATQEIIEAEEQQLALLQHRFDLGASSMTDLLAHKTHLAQTRATLPPLNKQLALIRNQLSALAGRFPDQDSGETFDLAELKLPEQLPVSLPSTLVRQRPDIRAAEAQLHKASAAVGVATANFFPKLSISSSYGTVATTAGSLFTPASGVWSLGGNLLQPVIHGGSAIHNRRAAVAGYQKATAQYQSTVLTAFRNVADVLRSLQADADALQAQNNAAEAAARQLSLAREQLNAGAIDNLVLLDAQRAYEQARIALVQASASRYADTAALFQALGGGWWNRPNETVSTEQSGS